MSLSLADSTQEELDEGIVPARALHAYDQAAAAPLLGPLLAPGELTLIQGGEDSGRSWLALAIAHAVACGGSVLGWRAPRPARVLYVDSGLSLRSLGFRTKALAAGTGSDGADRLQICSAVLRGGCLDLGREDDIAWLERQIFTGVDLLVLDDVDTLLGSGREARRRFADWLVQLRGIGLAVLVVAGPGRALRADTALALSRQESEDDSLRVRLSVTRGPAGLRARRFDLTLALQDGKAVWQGQEVADQEALSAWRLRAQGLGLREIGWQLGVSTATAWRLVERAKRLPAHLREKAEKIENAEKDGKAENAANRENGGNAETGANDENDENGEKPETAENREKAENGENGEKAENGKNGETGDMREPLTGRVTPGPRVGAVRPACVTPPAPASSPVAAAA